MPNGKHVPCLPVANEGWPRGESPWCAVAASAVAGCVRELSARPTAGNYYLHRAVSRGIAALRLLTRAVASPARPQAATC